MLKLARNTLAFAFVCLSLATHAQGALKAYTPRTAAPAFDLQGADGKQYRLADFAGKVLVVNFWATWCPPCRKEMPSMQRMWRGLQADGVELVAIDFGDDKDVVAAFAIEAEVEFPLLLDQKGAVLQQFKALGLPTTYVIDRRGKLAYVATGEREWDAQTILATLRKLAHESRS
jgi:peroxiredoxin